jgi:hypothetical protein
MTDRRPHWWRIVDVYIDYLNVGWTIGVKPIYVWRSDD